MAREIILPDVSGEMTQFGENQIQPVLKQEILDEYKDYDGYLIFVPANVTDPTKAAESKWQVDALLTALRERVPEGRTQIGRPIAVLVTKWDLIEPGPVTGPSEEQAAIFLEEIHPNLMSGLRTLCENLRIFPVSATGPLVDGRPPVPLRPTNLGEPIVWLIETTERVKLERALAYFEDNRSRLFRRVPGDEQRRSYRKIVLKRLNDFLEDVPEGPMAKEARKRIGDLRSITRKRLIRQVCIVMSIVAGMGFVVSGVRDQQDYHRAHQLIERGSPDLSARDVVAQVKAVLSEPFLFHPVGYTLTWRRTLRRDLEAYRKEFENQSFESIEQANSTLAQNDEKGAQELLQSIKAYEMDFPDSARLVSVVAIGDHARAQIRNIGEARHFTRINEDNQEYKTHSDDLELATKLLNQSETFEKEYPGSPQLVSVQTIRAQVQARISEINRTKKYQELRHELTRSAESPLPCYELCSEFLKNDPTHPRAHEVEVERDRFLTRADDRAWNEVMSFARNYPSLFPDQIRRCEDYLGNVLFKLHHDEANLFRKRAISGYDRSQYDAICKRASDGLHPYTLKAVNELCKKYIATPIPDRRMTAEVEAWSNWFDGWAKGKSFKVRVTTVRIERNSAWHHRFSIPDPWVHASIQIGSKISSTTARYISLGCDERDLSDNLLGPFSWKWGDPEVVVSLHHLGGSPPSFSTEIHERDAYPVRQLNGLTKFDDGKITVRLECPDVVPPGLPPYKD